jgi:hypothetical protein
MVETRWLTIDDIARYWKLRWSLQEAQRSAVLETSHRCVCGISETFIHHSNKCRARQCEKQRHNAWVYTPNLKQCAMDGANQQMCWKTHPNTHTHTCFDVQNLSQLIFQHSIHQAQPYSKSLVRVSTLRMNIQYHSMLMANDNSSLSFSRSYVQFLRMLRLCKKDHRKEHRKRGLKGAKTKQVLGKTHTANYCTKCVMLPALQLQHPLARTPLCYPWGASHRTLGGANNIQQPCKFRNLPPALAMQRCK